MHHGVTFLLCQSVQLPYLRHVSLMTRIYGLLQLVIKRPARDACLCMGELPAPPAPPAPSAPAAPLAPPAPRFVFLITL